MLTQRPPEAAVAIGAATYARPAVTPSASRDRRLLIRAGSGRAYYVGLRARQPPAARGTLAVCVLARGTDEGTRRADHAVHVATNQPIAFRSTARSIAGTR